MNPLYCVFGLFYFSTSTNLGGIFKKKLLGKHHSKGGFLQGPHVMN